MNPLLLRPAIIGAAAAVVFGLGGALGWTLRGPGAPAPAVRYAVRERVVATRLAARADTVYLTRERVLRRVLTQYDTARVTDTVVREEQGQHIVYVSRVAADSAVAACRSVVVSCAARHSADSLVIARLGDEAAALRADRPSGMRRVLTAAAWLGAGYVAGRITARSVVP